MRFIKNLFLTCGLLLLLYGCWLTLGWNPPKVAPRLELDLVKTLEGDSACTASVLAVQPYFFPADYATEAHFFAKLDDYLAIARRQGLLSDSALVILPEYLGTWLVTLEEKKGVYRARGIQSGMTIMVLSHPLKFLRHFFSAPAGTGDKVAYSLFAMKAPQMAKAFHKTFSRLAQSYRVYIVAGSILLPDPEVKEGVLHSGKGLLYNTAVLYRPDGSPDPQLTRKVFPIDSEKPFLSSGRTSEIPVYELPFGRLAVPVCADSWYPEVYEHLRSGQADLVAVPSFATGSGVMDQPWKGYNGAPAPADVDPADQGRLTEGEAWQKYALAGRLSSSGAARGINVFLKGKLWDLGGDGQPVIIRKGRALPIPRTMKACLIATCL